MEPLSMSSHIKYIYTISLKYDLNRPFYINTLLKWYHWSSKNWGGAGGVNRTYLM